MDARLYHHKSWILETNPTVLRHKFDELLVRSGFTILNYMEHHFEPYGFTAIWLLAESHFAIHTFPEHEKSYIELTSCSEEMYQQFLKGISF